MDCIKEETTNDCFDLLAVKAEILDIKIETVAYFFTLFVNRVNFTVVTYVITQNFTADLIK